jgi:hypothetical protein
MVGGLHKSHANGTLVLRSPDYRLHQQPAYSPVLHYRIYGDRSDARNRATLIEKVATDDPAIHLGYYTVDTFVSQHRRAGASCGLWVGEIGSESVSCCQLRKRLIADSPELRRIIDCCFPD